MTKFSFLIPILFASIGTHAAQEEINFHRDSALSKFESECSLDLALSMGVATERENGSSREDLEEMASSSKSPELLAVMVDEIFSEPNIQGGTYTFFKYENCLISKAISRPSVALDETRSSLLRCESVVSSLEELVACVDVAILLVHENR